MRGYGYRSSSRRARTSVRCVRSSNDDDDDDEDASGLHGMEWIGFRASCVRFHDDDDDDDDDDEGENTDDTHCFTFKNRQALNRYAKTPKITGYLLTGAALGRHGFGAVSAAGSARLWLVDNGCLACIGVAAGAEVTASELKRNARTTVVTILAIAVCTWVFVFASFDAAFASRLEFLQGLSERHVYAVGSLLGTLGIARSPASALAVINECEASGPFCSHVLSATVLKDVLVVALFAINVELVALSGLDFHKMVSESLTSGTDVSTSASAGAGASDSVASAARRLLVSLKPATQFERSHLLTKLLQPIIRVFGAVAAGVIAGVLLGRVLKPNFVLARWKNIKIGCIAACSASIFVLSEHVGLEPLLVCVTAGITAANRRHANGERERDELRATVSLIMPGVNLLFFTLAGASLRLENIGNSLAIAVGLVLVRLCALYCATAISARILKAPALSDITGEKRRNIEWMAHVTQAGVALGLARTVAARFPYWGPAFSTLAVSTIVINLFIGPLLFRFAIELMNESNSTLSAALERIARSPRATTAAGDSESIASP